MARDEIEHIFGKDVYDTDGDKIGVAAQVYVDDETDEPEWVTVRTGLLGTRESFVPLGQASVGERGLTVPFSKDFVKNAPNHDADGHLTPEEERELYAYYGSENSGDERSPEQDREAHHDDDGPVPSAVGEGRARDSRRDDTSDDERRAPTEDQATDDRLTSGSGGRDADRLRLRKVMVTENVTVTVPVQREKVIVEEQPADGGDLREEQVTVDDPQDDRR